MAVFDATSTTDDVLAGRDLSGLNAIVPGTSAGLGIETARALAARGAAVVGTARDIAKAERATADARRGVEAGGGSIELAALDHGEKPEAINLHRVAAPLRSLVQSLDRACRSVFVGRHPFLQPGLVKFDEH